MLPAFSAARGLHRGPSMQNNGGPHGLGDASRRLRDDLGVFFEAFTRSKGDLSTRIGAFLHDRPIASVGIAFGIGYVLAGGVFSKTTSRLLRIATRVGAVSLARNLMGDAFTAQPSRP